MMSSNCGLQLGQGDDEWRDARVAQADACAALSYLVIIPSFNSGPKLIETVVEARRYWEPIWVVIDGSTDGSAAAIEKLAALDTKIRVFVLPRNAGKGAAILHGLQHAEAMGFTHALTMDGDGQHPAALIPRFVAESVAHPDALILGKPVFDRSAPRIRVVGRKLSNLWAGLETLWASNFDSLFGFRIYPIKELRMTLEASRWMRRYDFDAEAAVRLSWHGHKLISLPAPVRYYTSDQGGVSHFQYLRDNLLLSWMHARLLLGFLLRLPQIAARRIKSSHH